MRASVSVLVVALLAAHIVDGQGTVSVQWYSSSDSCEGPSQLYSVPNDLTGECTFVNGNYLRVGCDADTWALFQYADAACSVPFSCQGIYATNTANVCGTLLCSDGGPNPGGSVSVTCSQSVPSSSATTSSASSPPPPPPPEPVYCDDGLLTTEPDRKPGFCTAYAGKPNCCPKDVAPTRSNETNNDCPPNSACIAQAEAYTCAKLCSTDQVAAGNTVCRPLAESYYAACKDAELKDAAGSCVKLSEFYGDENEFWTALGMTIGPEPCLNAQGSGRGAFNGASTLTAPATVLAFASLAICYLPVQNLLL